MLFVVPKRQSKPPPVVRVTEQAIRDELAEYIGARIRAAMERKGWVDGDRHDVKRLVEAIEQAGNLDKAPRWQTVQEWVLGKTAPRTHHAKLLAQALDMTLDELMGVALGREPNNAAWRAFVETPEGRSMTVDERPLVARMVVIGEPTVSAYLMQLMTVRAGRK